MGRRLGRGFPIPAPAPVAALGVLCLLAALPPALPASAASPSAAHVDGGSESNFTTLQLNLCNGGSAACYQDGLAIPEAVATIERTKPHLVSLNEICMGDLTEQRTENAVTLTQAMRNTRPSYYVYYVFAAALRANTGNSIKCRNGESFGSALMFHVAPDSNSGVEPAAFVYSDQLASSREWRTVACATVHNHFIACVTHLASGTEAAPVALRQCQTLMNGIVPALQDEVAENAAPIPVIVQGDLNLKDDGSDNDVDNCIPPGYARRGDQDVQYVVVSSAASFLETTLIDLKYTDHVGLLAQLAMPSEPAA